MAWTKKQKEQFEGIFGHGKPDARPPLPYWETNYCPMCEKETEFLRNSDWMLVCTECLAHSYPDPLRRHYVYRRGRIAKAKKQRLCEALQGVFDNLEASLDASQITLAYVDPITGDKSSVKVQADRAQKILRWGRNAEITRLEHWQNGEVWPRASFFWGIDECRSNQILQNRALTEWRRCEVNFDRIMREKRSILEIALCTFAVQKIVLEKKGVSFYIRPMIRGDSVVAKITLFFSWGLEQFYRVLIWGKQGPTIDIIWDHQAAGIQKGEVV